MIKRISYIFLSVLISILIVSGLVLLFTNTTQASFSRGTIIHVPGDFPTIQAAIDASLTGDTILVASGTYTENIDYLSKDITVTSELGPLPTIINGGHSGSVVNIGPLGRLIGFTLTNGYGIGAGAYANGVGTVIENNIFLNNAQEGGYWGAAIAGNSSSPIINRNIFINNSCDEQFLSGVVAFVNESEPLITNNIFRDNPCRAINMTIPVGNYLKVINNTLVGNTVGIRVDARIPTYYQIYRNNILTGNGIGLSIDLGSQDNYPTWDHNLVYGNGTDYDGIPDQTGLNGNISEDPQYANEPDHDYHLRFGSPAIDTGSNDLCPAMDYDALPRPIDGNQDWSAICDMGAYEFAQPLAAIQLDGPSVGWVNSGYVFTATASPITATIPITYIWQATGQLTITDTRSISDTVTFAWSSPGNQVINVIANGRLNTVSSTFALSIFQRLYLPLVTLNR